MKLFGDINLRQIIQELAGCEMGWEVSADMQWFKHISAKPDQELVGALANQVGIIHQRGMILVIAGSAYH